MDINIKDIQKTLDGYNSTLAECIQSISNSNEVNQKIVAEISETINKIKDKVKKAQNDVEEIGNRQSAFDDAIEQEQKQIKMQQQKHEESLSKERTRLEGELKKSESASAARIQELLTQQEEEIKRIKTKMSEEAAEALQAQHRDDEEKKKLALEEVEKARVEAEEKAKALAERTQKEANEAKTQAVNEAAEQAAKFKKLEEEKKAILEKDQKCEQTLNELKEVTEKMKEQIEELKGSLTEQIKINEADKTTAAAEKLAEIEQLNKEHETAMKTQIEKAAEDKKEAATRAQKEQEEAVHTAVEDAKRTYNELEEQKTHAANEVKDSLTAQLKECKASQAAYNEQVQNHIEKYNKLKVSFNESKHIVLDNLKNLVEDLGTKDIANLEKTIREILENRKGKGGTGTGGPKTSDESDDDSGEQAEGNPSIRRSDSTQEGMDMVSNVQKDIKDALHSNAPSSFATKNPLSRKKSAADFREDVRKASKPVADASKPVFSVDHIKNEYLPKSGLGNLNDKTAIMEDPLYLWLKSLIYFTNQDMKKGLLPNILGKLKGGNNQNVDKHIGDYVNNLLQAVIEEDRHHKHHLFTNKSTEQIHKIYGGLIAASFTMHDPKVIGQRLLHPSSEVNKNTLKVFKDEAKFIINHYLHVDGGENAFTNDTWLQKLQRSGGEDFINSPSFKPHEHSFDNRKSLQGGFRHGKRSQKKNKRTLKSKLTAKKYSLKIGKKKKGKKGNKSQKRRKSIKIRI